MLHGGARALLARLYLARGDAEKAQAIYERVVAESPEIAPAKNDLAFMLASRGGDLERALRLAEEADRALPESANAADTRGFVLLRLGRHEAALEPLRSAVARAEPDDPSLPTFHYHLGLALAGLARGERGRGRVRARARARRRIPRLCRRARAARRASLTRRAGETRHPGQRTEA